MADVLISSIVGFITGWILRLLFAESAERLIERPLKRRVRLLLSRFRNWEGPYNAQLLRIGPRQEKVFVHSHYRGGLASTNLICRWKEPDFRSERDGVERWLDWSPSEFERQVNAAREALEQKEQFKSPRVDFPGAHLALRAVRRDRLGSWEQPVLRLWFGESDEATYRAVAKQYEKLRVGDRLVEDSENLEVVHAGLSHGFGVNATIVTRDGRLLLTKRGRSTRKLGGRLHISVNEGMRLDDKDANGLPDIKGTLFRGIKEEIGVDISEEERSQVDVAIHTLVTDLETEYCWAVLCHVDLGKTGWTWEKVHESRALAADPWESPEMFPIEWRTKALGRYLEKNRNWVPWGLLNVILSAQVDGLRGAHELMRFCASDTGKRRRAK